MKCVFMLQVLLCLLSRKVLDRFGVDLITEAVAFVLIGSVFVLQVLLRLLSRKVLDRFRVDLITEAVAFVLI